MSGKPSLPWHDAQWHHVQRLDEKQRLPHALLLTGANGVGKERFAERFAQWLLCQQSVVRLDACGECVTCRLYEAGTHPDLRRVSPEESGKAIRIDAIRDLIDYLALKSQYGGYKVAIITPADRLNSAAANALLKTLEEPTAQTLVILVTARPSYLPATVRSRCQTITFGRPPRNQALEWLRECGVESPEVVLDACAGAPLAALGLASSGESQARQQLLEDLREVESGRVDPIVAAGRYAQQDSRIVCSWLLSYVADMIRLAMVSEPPELCNADLRDPLDQLVQDKQIEALFGYQDILMQAQRMADTSANAQLMMEDLLVRWIQLTAGAGKRRS